MQQNNQTPESDNTPTTKQQVATPEGTFIDARSNYGFHKYTVRTNLN